MRSFKLVSAILLIVGVILSGTYGAGAAPVEDKAIANGAPEEAAFEKDYLEKLIRLVKTRITIPEDYTEFSSSVGYSDGKPYCRLSWSSSYSYYSGNGGSIDVNVDETGNINSYRHNRYIRDYDYNRRLPAISKAQATSSARKFLYYICPEIADRLVLDEGTSSQLNSEGNFKLDYIRMYKGVPYADDGVSIQVSGTTGEVLSFSRNWRDDAVFPEPEAAIKPEAARELYENMLELSLKYRRTYGKDEDITYLEYSPAGTGFFFGIDALKGEKVDITDSYNSYYDQLYKIEAYRREGSQYARALKLEEEKPDELKELEGLVTVQEAEKLAREMSEAGIEGDYSLNSFSYEREANGGNYTLRLTFMKLLDIKELPADIPAEKLNLIIAAGDGVRMITVTIDAVTKDFIGLTTGGFLDSPKQGSYDRSDMLKTAESFLKKYTRDRYQQVKLKEIPENMNPYELKYRGIDSNDPGSFTFVRMVNGIPFEDNTININVDPIYGTVSEYSEVWDTTEFVPTAGVISAEEAYAVLREANGLKLKYVTIQPLEQGGYPTKDMVAQGNEIKLVYVPDFTKPLCVDAVKGTLINYFNMEDFKEPGTLKYDDISGHRLSGAINEMAALGILPDEESFMPEKPMLQKDYLRIINNIRGSYYYSSSSGSMSQQEMDGMYRSMINDGIIDEKEREPDREITREEAVKYLLRLAGYRKFAELNNLFQCDFADRDEIAPENVGYAAIAASLGIIRDESFMPKKVLNRGEAAELIYNYLKRP